MIFHNLLSLFTFSRYVDIKINGKARPAPYINNSKPPVSTELVVDARNKSATKIGPTHGVHEIPRAEPNKKDPR